MSEKEAEEKFLEVYQGKGLLNYIAHRFTTNKDEKDDLVQEMASLLLERLHREGFDPQKGTLRTWIYRAAFCHAVDLRRKAGRKLHERMGGSDAYFDATDRSHKFSEGERFQDTREGNPLNYAATKEECEIIQKALEDMRAEDSRLLTLRYVEGMNLQEIAREVGLSGEQARYRLKKATGIFRRKVVRSYDSFRKYSETA